MYLVLFSAGPREDPQPLQPFPPPPGRTTSSLGCSQKPPRRWSFFLCGLFFFFFFFFFCFFLVVSSSYHPPTKLPLFLPPLFVGPSLVPHPPLPSTARWSHKSLRPSFFFGLNTPPPFRPRQFRRRFLFALSERFVVGSAFFTHWQKRVLPNSLQAVSRPWRQSRPQALRVPLRQLFAFLYRSRPLLRHGYQPRLPGSSPFHRRSSGFRPFLHFLRCHFPGFFFPLGRFKGDLCP